MKERETGPRINVRGGIPKGAIFELSTEGRTGVDLVRGCKPRGTVNQR